MRRPEPPQPFATKGSEAFGLWKKGPDKAFSHAPECKIVEVTPDVEIPWSEIERGRWEAVCVCGTQYFREPVAGPPRLDPLDPSTGRGRLPVFPLAASGGLLFAGPVPRLRLGFPLLALAALPLLAPPTVGDPLVRLTALDRAEGPRATRHRRRGQRATATGARGRTAARGYLLRLICARSTSSSLGAGRGKTESMPSASLVLLAIAGIEPQRVEQLLSR
jgi:hypothetical protein